MGKDSGIERPKQAAWDRHLPNPRKRRTTVFRKITAVALFVSFIAMSSSGLMMFVIEKPSFTIQMHPVHKIFGLLMIVAVIAHLSFNYRSLFSYLKQQRVAVAGGVLVAALVALYAVAINNEVPPELAQQMDEAAAKVEEH